MWKWDTIFADRAMKMRISTSIALAVTFAVAAMFAAGCGSDSESNADGNATDAAFARDMIDHHRDAIEMAAIANDRAKYREVKKLAAAIAAAQQPEIELMTRIGKELQARGVNPGSLGMSHAQMGMNMDASMLTRAEPFDRAFLEMMIPHHRGAVAMAKIELAKGSHAESLKLARSVIDTQTAEIEQMQSMLKERYGSALPESSDGSMQDGTMNHEGM